MSDDVVSKKLDTIADLLAELVWLQRMHMEFWQRQPTYHMPPYQEPTHWRIPMPEPCNTEETAE